MKTRKFSHKIKLFGCQFLTSKKEFIKENAGTLSEFFFLLASRS